MKNIQSTSQCLRNLLALLMLTFLSCSFAIAQENVRITGPEKEIIYKKAVDLMTENYVFPERVKAIEAFVGKKIHNGGYNDQTMLFDFLEILNKDFEVAGNDHHLNIFYGPAYVKKIKAASSNSTQTNAAVPAEFIAMISYENFFLKKVERLDGNIGYFKLNKFEELQFSKEAIASAMNFISHSSAIIIDLTQNGGGSAETVHFLMNYFLPDSTRLGTFKRRINNETIDLWTEKDPLIQKIPKNIPLYILVSKNTSSAAESFAYGLQQFKRAVIIGDQTHGEGNPGKRFVVNDLLYMMVPTATNVNIVTGTNWEGTGVIPDIKIETSHAFQQALVESYKLLARRATDKELKQLYEWMFTLNESQVHPSIPTNELIQSVTGDYGQGKKITSECDGLYFINSSGRFRMQYMGGNVFAVEKKDYRLRFPDSKSLPYYYEAFWMDGGSEKTNRISKY